jgi:uncharacterized protein with HEPN domain
MPPDARDPAYLWDMLDAALAIREFTGGTSFREYTDNKMMRSAVERQLEILGEAARRVSDAFKQRHPEIAWRQIVGLRNVLAHEYGDIRQERIWQIVSRDLPALIEQLKPLVPPRP